jgi:hypothetical protein
MEGHDARNHEYKVRVKVTKNAEFEGNENFVVCGTRINLFRLK